MKVAAAILPLVVAPAAAENIAVINTHDDGRITASVVALPDYLPPPFKWVVCIREFVAPAVRCYAIDPTTKELQYVDYTVKDYLRRRGFYA